MKNNRNLLLPGIALPALLSLSCQQPDYRVEVSPGEQGRTEIRRVPLSDEEKARRQRMRELSAAAANPVDSDIVTLEALWPRIAPADRDAILDMARRSAGEKK
ncbi:MAG TPA: hypothetical protein VHD56_02320 [Tepidisphaeraceae bacterium]|nr:hypothetical protein [Tepidisphaeraceae bacterium]